MSVPSSYGSAEREPVTVNLEAPRRALAIGAHPDDIEFGCGATLAKWASKGCEVFHLVCTDGSKGTWDPDVDVAQLVATRQAEQRAAARQVGGGREPGDVVFLGWVDGELESGLRQRWEVAFWIRHFRPDVVLGHDPWRRYRLHPDHRNAGFLATDGIVAARDPKFFPEQRIAPHRPSTLLLWEAEEPNHVEDIDGFTDAKVAALLEHGSQFESTMRMPSGTAPDLDNVAVAAFRDRVVERCARAGAHGNVAYGEAFWRMTDL